MTAEVIKPKEHWIYLEKPDGEVARIFAGYTPIIGRPVFVYENKLLKVVGLEEEADTEPDDFIV